MEFKNYDSLLKDKVFNDRQKNLKKIITWEFALKIHENINIKIHKAGASLVAQW